MIVANYIAAACVFGLGLYTVLSRRNLIKIVMGLSLMECVDISAPDLPGLPPGVDGAGSVESAERTDDRVAGAGERG